MTITASELARKHGLAESDVTSVLSSNETGATAARRLGIAPVVADDLVGNRKPKAEKKVSKEKKGK